MKRIPVLVLAALCVLAGETAAQLDRSKIPPPGPAPAASFPEYDLVTMPNGMRVIIVRNTELPTVTIRLLIDREPVLEKETVGALDLTGQLMRCGTTKRTKDQLDEEIDAIGAEISASGTSVSANGLSRHTEKILALLADITLRPSFPKDELSKLVMQTQSALKMRATEPDAIVDVVRKKVLYGESHPYGEVESEASVGRATVAQCRKLYGTYFKPNAAIMAVVGDVDKKNVVSLVGKYFGGWKKGKIPTPNYPAVAPLPGRTVALVDRPSSVQSVMRVAQGVPLLRTSPDVTPVKVMNTILGGGGFRLFLNLREKHSFTYGAYSSMGPDELIGAFAASTSVRNSVTDSALTEIFSEINRIRDEEVTAAELDRAKNSLSGGFVQSLETAGTVANYAIEMERFDLPKDYYKTYLQRVAAVNPKDVQRVARQYLTPDKMLVAVVGSAKDVKEKLAAFGPVTLYDEEGKKVVEKPTTAPALSADEIFGRYIERTGGKEKYAALKDRTVEMSGKIQGMDMKVKLVQKAPTKLYQEMAMMGMVQKTGYDGTKGWASSPMGMQDLEGDQLDAMKFESPIDLYSQYKDVGLKAEATGTKEIKGKECYEVTFSSASGSPMRHYFDTKDFLKVREVSVRQSPRGAIETVTDLSDYKDFGGYLMSSKMEQTVMGQSFAITVDKCAVNTGVPDSIFVKPAAAPAPATK
ncbi:MAG: processing peptidase [Bacteroidetes bacterium]|nr:processing peptidase [Bacteroidota bacterium]